jgi:2-oxoglutarate ferredoxin oxidoreductase subunit alpha
VTRMLMDGNSAIGEAAIRAGCQCYFGYPITPQNELTEYMATHLSRRKGCSFIQAESEISAINMVFGASAVGARVMSRGGPGLGTISAAQSDYFQATRGGGHGDYRTIVLAPSSVQELADLTHKAFDMADRYRIPVIILGDGMLGQMQEPVEFKHEAPAELPLRSDALRGASGRPSKIVRTCTSNTSEMEELNWSLYRRYQLIEKKETVCDTFLVDDAELIVVAYGIAARIAKGAIKNARANGLKVGLARPITLWPFPSGRIRELADTAKCFLVFEMNMGQMLEDVQLALKGQGEIFFYGRPGGVIPTPSEVLRVISRHYYQRGLKKGK